MIELVKEVFYSLPESVKEIINLGIPLFDSAHNFYWIYILFSLILLLGLYRISHPNPGNFSWLSLLSYCFPHSIYTHKSAILDYQCYFINGLIKILIRLTLLISVTEIVAKLTTQSFYGIFREPRIEPDVNFAAKLAYTIAVVFAIDFGYFLAHYLLHKVPILWEFHKTHHSAQVLTPVTAKRDHPVDDMIIYTCKACLLGLVTGLFRYTFKGDVEPFTIAGVSVIIYLFHLTSNLRHFHVWISYGWHLNHLLVSPAMHQIHHSQLEKHYDKNLGLIFSIWDYLAGTLYVPKEPETFSVGLVEEEFNNVWQLYFSPFSRVTKIVGRGNRQ
jgi:sterol desaturase/sphingolipid hydroxylase (fatty acid hydroxylase superfamily)